METEDGAPGRMATPVEVVEARRALLQALERLQTRPAEALWLLADAGALIADRLLPAGERAGLLDLELATGCGFRFRPEEPRLPR